MKVHDESLNVEEDRMLRMLVTAGNSVDVSGWRRGVS